MRFLIDGCYGDGNVGDEALLRAVITLIRDVDSTTGIAALSSSPSETERLHKVRSIRRAQPLGRTIYGAILKAQLFRVLWAILRCDCFVLGGGELFRDDVGIVPTFEMFYPLLFARLVGKRCVALGVGAQRPTSRVGRWILTGALFACHAVVFRDPQSVEIAQALTRGRRRFSSTSDLVFSLARAGSADSGITDPCNSDAPIAIAIKEVGDRFMSADSRARLLDVVSDTVVSLAKRTSVSVVMLAFGVDDIPITSSLCELLRGRGISCAAELSLDLDRIIRTVRTARCVIAMPLHASVLAMANARPSLGLAYDYKVEKLYGQVGLKDFCVKAAQVDEPRLDRALESILSDPTSVANRIAGYLRSERHRLWALASEALFGTAGDASSVSFLARMP